jgi:hypothetical protein
MRLPQTKKLCSRGYNKKYKAIYGLGQMLENYISDKGFYVKFILKLM